MEACDMDVKEIGGDYSVSEERLKCLSLQPSTMPDAKKQYISTCRSAIRELLKEFNLKIKIAFVPAFTCHVVVEPFLEDGYDVYPYSLNRDLSVNWNNVMRDVEIYNPSVVLLHSYFGINTLPDASEYISELKKRGVYIIEDETHSMFSDFEHLDTPYHIGSIRKWLPIPDGAYITGLDHKALSADNDVELVNAKLKAMIEKSDYITHSRNEKTLYREIFVIAEEILDTRRATYGMSDVSIRMYNATAWDSYYQARRLNYNYLSENINNSSVIPILPKCRECEVPFMFPVYVKGAETRIKLQRYMVENKVFPTIIWGIPEGIKTTIDDEVQYIYEHILCFHCDQRYTIDDMSRLIFLLNNFK